MLSLDFINAEETERDARKIIEEIRFLFQSNDLSYYQAHAIAYVIFKSINLKLIYNDSFEDIFNSGSISEEIKELVKPLFTTDIWHRFQELASRYDERVFEALCFMDLSKGNDFYNETPFCLVNFAHVYSDIQPQDYVMDLCCGGGKYMSVGNFLNKPANYFGVEKQAIFSTIYKTRCDLLGTKPEFIANDVFDLPEEFNGRFDKIFMDYPMGLRIFKNGVQVLSDWHFVEKAIDLLKPTGELFTIMSPSALYRSSMGDEELRSKIINENLIKAIIVLPENLTPKSSIPQVVVIFGKNDTDKIRYVNASSIFERGRRRNTLSEENIKMIINLLSEESNLSKDIPISDIRKNKYNLNPNKYLVQDLGLSDGQEFGSVIKKIKRGFAISAADRDKLDSEKDTGIKLVTPKDIAEGRISKDLQYISMPSMPESHIANNLIHNNNLVLSKNGLPVKIAVADVKENEMLFAHPNLYVIELKEGNNPYYFKAFFESPLGEQCLKNIAVGNTLVSLGKEDLLKMKIPVPSKDKQDEIAKSYLALQDEIDLLELKKARAIEKKMNLCQEAFK